MSRVAVVGPGAMGRLFAALLSRAGHDVVIVDHRPERAAALSASGYRLTGRTEIPRVRVPVTCAPEGDFDLALVCVKAYDTATVAAALPGWLGEATVLTLQNGFGNVEALRKYVDPSRLLVGVTAQGANIPTDDPETVVHAGVGETLLGAVAPAGNRALAAALELLSSADVQPRAVEDVRPHLFGKLLVNAAINPVCGLLRIRNGELPETEPAWRLSQMLLREGETLAAAEGIVPPWPETLERVREICAATAPNRCSTLQDVEAGRRTEIPQINGYIARRAAELGLAAPANHVITLVYEALAP